MEAAEKAMITVISAVIFYIISRILEKYELISGRVPMKKRNLWFNTLGSLLHSTIASICCVVCLWLDPLLYLDMTAIVTTLPARLTPSISLGYFSYDFFHVAMKLQVSKSWPVLAHHVIVVSIFIAVGSYLEFYNYLIVALSCEVNTIFLHLRQLFHLSDVSQSWFVYKLNKHINLITYILFRMVTLTWMIVCAVFYDRDKFPSLLLWGVGVVGMMLMYVINLVLLHKVIRRDYFQNHEHKKR